MKKSLFEKILKDKAQDYKPMVSPAIFDNIMDELEPKSKKRMVALIRTAVASGKLGFIKNLAAKSIFTSKMVVSVASVTTVATTGYVVTEKIINNTNTKKSKSEITNTLDISSQIRKEALRAIPSGDGIINTIPENIDSATINTSFLNSNISEDYEQQEEHEFENYYNKLSGISETSNSIEFSAIKSIFTNRIPASDKLDSKINYPLSRKRDSITSNLSDFTTAFIFNAGNSENIINDNKNLKGDFQCIELESLYKITKNVSSGIRLGYLKNKTNTKFYTDTVFDGTFSTKSEYLTVQIGANFNIYKFNRISFNMAAFSGLAFKLKHINTISGKYFEHSFEFNQKDQDKASPLFSGEFNLNYNITKRLKIGSGFYTNYIFLNTNQKSMNYGAQFKISYVW